MKCSISEEQQDNFLENVTEDLLDIIENNKPFDIKSYMSNIYTEVYDVVNTVEDKHSKALDYARLAGIFTEQILSLDDDIKAGLRKAGLDLNALSDMVANIKNDDTGLEATATYLEVTDPIKDLINFNKNIPIEVRESKTPPVVEQTAVAKSPVTRLFNFVGQTLSSMNVIPYMQGGQASSEADVRLGATPLYDVLFEDRNVPNNFYDKVKRMIVSLLPSVVYNTGEKKLMLDGIEVYLTAKAASTLSAEQLGDIDLTKGGNDVLLILTDQDGTPFEFIEDDEKGMIRVDSGGQVAHYRLRDTDKVFATTEPTLLKQDEERIKNLARTAYNKLSPAQALEEARAQYIKQLELIHKMREHVRSKPESNMVKSIITGGTVGYAVKNEKIDKPIKDLDFEGQSFTPYFARADQDALGESKGYTYFKVDGFYGQPIEIQRPTVDNVNGSTAFKDKLISILVDDIVDENGIAITPIQRQTLTDWFIETNREGIQVHLNDKTNTYTLMLKGNVLDLSTPEAIETSRTKLNNYFTKYDATREIEKKDIKGRDVISPKDTYDVYKTDKAGNRIGAYLNKVVEVTNNGITKYFVVEKPHLHIKGKEGNAIKILANIHDVNLTKDDAGHITMKSVSYPYSEFIRNNFTIRYVLEKNKLRKYSPYMTFQPTDEDLNKVLGTSEANAVEEDVLKNSADAPINVDQKIKAIDETPGLLDLGSFDDLLKNTNEDNTLNKLVVQKQINVTATAEQLKAAEEWWNSKANTELRSRVPLDVLFTMVNTKTPGSIASWSAAGITLNQGSDYSDLYHESWHAFSQLFLTKDQKKALYNEVSRKIGSFTDYNGKRTTFKAATFKQLEEYLAEDFRSFMLDGKAKVNEPVRNSLFDKILRFLNTVFGNSTLDTILLNEKADKTIGEIYEKLRVGNLAEWTFSQDNMMFGELNATMQATMDTASIQALNHETTRVIQQTVDSFLSDWIDFRNSGLGEEAYLTVSRLNDELRATKNLAQRTALLNQIKAIYTVEKPKATYANSAALFNDPAKLLEGYKWAWHRIGQLYNNTVKQITTETNSVTKERLQKQADTLLWAYKNFGDLKSLSKNKFADLQAVKGVIGYHIMKSEQYLSDEIKVSLDYEDIDDENKLWLKGKSSDYDQQANGTSLKALAKEEVLFLIKGLRKLNAAGEVELNSLGAPQLVEFQHVWNRLARVLQNTIDPSLIEAKLQKEAEAYPIFEQLLKKLGPLATGSAQEAQLWTNFLKIFTLPRVPLVQMTVEKQSKTEDGIVWNSNIGETSNADTKVLRKWQSSFNINPDLKYTKHDSKGYYLNTKVILEAFQEGTKANPAPVEKQLKGREYEFLHAIGLKISDNPAIIEAISKRDDVVWIYRQIARIAERGLKIREFTDLTTKVYPEEKEGGIVVRKEIKTTSSNIKRITEYHAKYADEESNFMVSNAEGNTQFEHSLNNSMTIIVSAINNAVDYQDLINMPHMAHFNIKTNPFAAASNWLNSIFVLDTDGPTFGSRRKVSDKVDDYVRIEYKNLAGILLKEEEGEGDFSTGVASAKADEVTKMILDFHLVTQMGQPELMRHADKSTSYSAFLKHIYNKNRESLSSHYIDNTRFMTDAYKKDSYNLLIGHINAEFKRIKIMRTMTNPENIDFNYWMKGKDFVAFNDVLTDSQITMYKLVNEIDDLEVYLASGTPEANLLKVGIAEEIDFYFAKQVSKIEVKFNENAFIADNLNKNFSKEVNETLVKNEIIKVKDNTVDARKSALIKSYVYNYWINNIESVAFFYGDAALFNHDKEEFHKRNAGMGSTGTVYRTDPAMLDLINDDKVIGRPFTKKHGGKVFPYDGTFKTAILQDQNVKSIYYDSYVDIFTKHYIATEKLSKTAATKKAKYVLRNYGDKAMNEGDGQGWISMDSYRILKTSEGTWSGAQDDLYQDMLNGKTIEADQIIEFFPTLKAQYFGVLKETMNGLPITAMHKFSLFPLIPSVIKGTNLQLLHEKMMTEGIDYTTFESGSKVGNITKTGTADGTPVYDKFYLDAERKSVNMDEPFTQNTIFVNYLKNQLEISPEFKKKVTFSTQLRKLIEDGLMQNGVPTDFAVGKDADTRIKEWDKLIGDDVKQNASPRYALLKAYENDIAALTKEKENELLADINWQRKTVKDPKTGKNVEIIDGKLEDLLLFVKKELTRQDLADHEVDFSQSKDGKVVVDLSLSLSAEKIEKLLNALVVKRLIRQKVNGDGLIQVATSFFEKSNASTERFKKATQEELERYKGTNDLPTYIQRYDKKGNPLVTSAMKIKVALRGDFLKLLKATHLDGELIGDRDRLNDMIQNDEWLNTGRNREMITMVGVRIPVQGMNSMEFMEVYEFLPAEAGNILIPPSEIVAKSGSDFDIDKLTIMMPNLTIINGKVELHTTKLTNKSKEVLTAERSVLREKIKDIKDKYDDIFDRHDVTNEFAWSDEQKKIIDDLKELKKIQQKNINNLVEDWVHLSKLYTKPGNVRDMLDIENQLNMLYLVKHETEEKLVGYYKEFGSAKIKEIAAKRNAELTPVLDKQGQTQRELDSLSVEAIENSLLNNIRRILELPSNFINLIKPNSTDIFTNKEGTGIAQDLAADVSKYNPLDVVNGKRRVNSKGKSIISATRIFEVEYNLYKHSTNNIGGQTLGLGAVDNTYNTLFNRIGFHLNPTAGTTTKEFNRISKIEPNNRKAWEVKLMKKYHRQKLFLPSWTLDVDGERGISLSHETDVNGEHRIADVINQMLNGWLDIAKDTWIFNIQGNKEVSPTLLFLLQAGVPVKSAVYFASMPMVRDYVDEIRAAKGLFAEPLNKIAIDNEGNIQPYWFKNQARKTILGNPKYGFNITASKLGKKTDELINKEAITRIEGDVLVKGVFDQKAMRARIADYGKDSTNYEYNDLDRAAFLHFLEAENMAAPIRDLKLRMNVDTGKSSTLFEAQARILSIAELKEDARIPVEMIDRILKDSPISSFYIQPFQVAIWKDLFPLRNHPAVTDFLLKKFADRDTQDHVKNTFGDSEKFANEYLNAIVSLIFQNTVRSFDYNAKYYRGYEIEQLAIQAALENKDYPYGYIPIENVTHLRQGIFRGISSQPSTSVKTKGFKLSIDKKGKDQGKADLANAFISHPNPNTSSYQYLQDAKKQGIPVNDKIKSGPGVIVFVSVNGSNRATDKQIEDTYLHAREIIEAGGTIIMDSTKDANSSWNKSGEALVQEQLDIPSGQTSKGYNYWGPNPEETTQPSTSVDTSAELEDKLYVDHVRLNADFDNKWYAGNQYTMRGLAKVNTNAFATRDEYFNFVYEREVLRKTNPLSIAKQNSQYIAKRNQVGNEKGNEQYAENETDTEYGVRLDRIAYEEFLRDTALTNTFNNWSLFKGTSSFAKQYDVIMDKYGDMLRKDYTLLNQLVTDITVNFSNLKLNDTLFDGDLLNVLHENIINLADVNVRKVENDVDNKMISDFFHKLSIVAFLQSGMNTKSSFSLTRLVPTSVFNKIMERPKKEYIKHFDVADDSNLTPPILDELYDHFININSFKNRSSRIRGQQVNFTHKSGDAAEFKTPYKLNDSIKQLKKDIKLKADRKAWFKLSPAEKAKVLEPGKTPTVKVYKPLDKLKAPLVIIDTDNVFGYDNDELTVDTIVPITTDNEDKLFIFNLAVESTSAASGVDSLFFGKRIANSMGLPTLRVFSDVQNQLEDVVVNGVKTISEANRLAIDSAIAAIKADGRPPVFSQSGYGQQMIGVDLKPKQVTKAVYEDAKNDTTRIARYTESAIKTSGEIITTYWLQRGINSKVGKARETFLYLSKQLLDNFNYINPNYLRTKEGLEDIQSGMPIQDSLVVEFIISCKG